MDDTTTTTTTNALDSSNSNPANKKKKFTIPSLKDVEEVRGVKIDSFSLFEKRKEVSTSPLDIGNATTNINNTTPYKQNAPTNNFTTPAQAIKSSNSNSNNTTPSPSLQKSTPVTRSPYFTSSSKPNNNNNNNNTTPPNDNNNNNNSNNSNNSDNQGNSPPPRSLSFGEAFSFIQSDPNYTPPAISPPLQTATTTTTTAIPPIVNSDRSPIFARTPQRLARSIIIHPNQRKNPILKYVKNVPFEVGNIIPDYVLGETTCALFLSLKYHNLHPTYILDRTKEIIGMYKARILLVMVDIEDVVIPVQELSVLAIKFRLSLILAFSNYEAARYLETYKAYEHKSADSIKPRQSDQFSEQLQDVLTSIRAINKSDVTTLASNFGTLADIIEAQPERFSECPGFGERKVNNLYEAFHTPFKANKKPTALKSSATQDQDIKVDDILDLLDDFDDDIP